MVCENGFAKCWYSFNMFHIIIGIIGIYYRYIIGIIGIGIIFSSVFSYLDVNTSERIFKLSWDTQRLKATLVEVRLCSFCWTAPTLATTYTDEKIVNAKK